MEELRGAIDPAVVVADMGITTIKEIWLLTATIMVMFMQAGFLMLEAGSVRSKNTINVAQKNIADFIVCGCVFLIIGGPIMLGTSIAGTFGILGWGGLDFGDSTVRLQFLYQFAFCATAATIISGAVAERMTFNAYVCTTVLIAAFVYPIFGHLAWGNAIIPDNPSFLADLGFLDYAGSTVVHTIGGMAALAAVCVVGSRHGRFDENGKPVVIRGHSTVLSNFGTMVLMFGWIGFNAGAADPTSGLVSKIVLNTIIAMTFGGCAGMLYGLWKSKGKTHPKVSANGILGGLVAMTAGCAYYDPYTSALVGLLGGLVAVGLGDIMLHKFKLDDPIDAISVHAGSGILGTLLIAGLAEEQFLNGSRLEQFVVQLMGVALACTFAFITVFVFMKVLSKVLRVRVSVLEEELGLNLSEHDDEFDVTEAESVLAVKSDEEDLSKGIGETIGEALGDSNQQIGTLSRIVKGANITQLRILEAEDEIVNLATRDQLTGLHNRRAFKEEILNLKDSSNGDETGFAVLYIDLDGFKSINDGFGHNVGDEILRVVSQRLVDAAQDGAVVSRFGGDEFVVKLPVDSVDQSDHWKDVTSEIISSISEKIELDNLELYVGASVGVSLYPDHDRRLDELILKSDMALYEAKSTGKGKWVVFDRSMEDRAMRRKELEADMRAGMERDEFFVEYQPQVSISEGSLVGFEALMRWRHPVHGLISPMEFIPIAEETGLIVPLSESLVETACAAARDWPLVRGKRCTVGVNISPSQFTRSDVYSSLKQILERTGLPAECLEIEVTESMLVTNMQETKATLEQIRSLGVKIAIDDFGTGYSSLSYLQEFPIDRLKVDRSFVREIENSASDQRIAKAIVDLGKSLGLSVIAEGVETEGQRQFLEELCCDQLQGFLYSPPVSLVKTLSLITRANMINDRRADKEVSATRFVSSNPTG